MCIVSTVMAGAMFFYALTHARLAYHVFRLIQNCILLSFNVIYLLPSFLFALNVLMLLFTIINMLIQIFCLTLPPIIYSTNIQILDNINKKIQWNKYSATLSVWVQV